MKPTHQQFQGQMRVDKDCLEGTFVKGEHVIVTPLSGRAVLVKSLDHTKCGYVAMGEVSLDAVIKEAKP
jgi:hypothetical protein